MNLARYTTTHMDRLRADGRSSEPHDGTDRSKNRARTRLRHAAGLAGLKVRTVTLPDRIEAEVP